MGGGKRKVVVCSSVIIILVLCYCSAAAEKKSYQLKLKDDMKYYMRIAIDWDITQSANGQEFFREQGFGYGYDIEVDEVTADGNIWLKCTYKWVRTKNKGPKRKMVYDSAVKDAIVPRPTLGFKALLDESFYIELTPQGRVKKINGLGRVLSNVRMKLPTRGIRRLLMPIVDHLKEEAMKKLFEQVLAVYPDDAVKAGDRWQRKGESLLEVPVVIENKWRVKEADTAFATFEVDMVITQDPNKKEDDQPQAKTTYNFSGKGHREVKINESTGLIVYSEQTEEISGYVKTEAKTAVRKELVVETKVKNVVTFEMKRRR